MVFTVRFFTPKAGADRVIVRQLFFF